MEHQTCTYEQPQMDVIVTDGGVTTDDFGINIGLIGQKVCLDRTHVPLMLIQPEREGVLAVEFFPDSPVTPFRPPIALFRG